MVETREAAKPRRRSKSANQIGDEIIAKRRDTLKLSDNVLPFIEDAAGRFFAYDGIVWQEITEASLKAMVFTQHSNSKNTFRLEVIHYLRAISHRREHEWERAADYEVPCRNGVVDVRTGKKRAHRAEDYLESVIPWDWTDESAPPSALMDYFTTCFGEMDAQRPLGLQHLAGYVILPHARFKKAGFLQGPGDSGKTQFAMVLRQLVGAAATCTLSIEDMDDPVLRSVLVGKRLNVLTELTPNALMRDSAFKTLVSTEDPIGINPKYGQPFSYSPIAKHIFVANELPHLNQRAEEVLNRVYVVPFNRVIPAAEQDEGLQAKFTAEMPRILRWAVEGAKQLIQARGKFPAIELAVEKIQEMREQSNPIIAFVREMMQPDAGAVTKLSSLVSEFNKWKAGGKSYDVRQLGKALRLGFGDDAVTLKWHGPSKANAQVFVGWQLRDESERAGNGRTDLWTDRLPPSSDGQPG